MSIPRRGKRRATGVGGSSAKVILKFAADASVADVIAAMQEHPGRRWFAETFRTETGTMLQLNGKQSEQPRPYQGRL